MIQIPESPKATNPTGVKETMKRTTPTHPNQGGNSLVRIANSEIASTSAAIPVEKGKEEVGVDGVQRLGRRRLDVAGVVGQREVQTGRGEESGRSNRAGPEGEARESASSGSDGAEPIPNRRREEEQSDGAQRNHGGGDDLPRVVCRVERDDLARRGVALGRVPCPRE